MMINGYIKLFVILISTAFILTLPIFYSHSKKGAGFARPFSYLLFFWSLIAVIFATIILFNLPFRFTPEQSVLNLQPLRWLQESNISHRIISEISPNIILFIPLGIFTPIAFKRMRKFHLTAMFIFTITFCIEFFQYFIGRSSDIDDIIANLLGGMIGYGAFKIFSFFLKKIALWNRFIEA